MERVAKFLKEAETYYLATVEGDQPRVRPFGTAQGKRCVKADSRKSQSRNMCIQEWRVDPRSRRACRG